MALLPEFNVWAHFVETSEGRSLRLRWLDQEAPLTQNACCIYFCGHYRIFCYWAEGKKPDQDTLERLSDPIIEFVETMKGKP